MTRLTLAALLLCTSVHAVADSPNITLTSGYFDDYLMISADKKSGILTGYYNDGKCKFYIYGPLEPVELYQRRDFGEAYTPSVILIEGNGGKAKGEIYSRAKSGYYDQITIEPHLDDIDKACRSRMTLDRSSSVSKSFIGIRVVRHDGAGIYQIDKTENEHKMRLDTEIKPPERFKGVWVVKSYSSYSPPGYLYVNWYDEENNPRGGYIKSDDLYPGF